MTDDLKKYYENYYESHGDYAYRGKNEPYTSRLRLIHKFLHKYCKPGDKALDIGSGDFSFKERFQDYSWTGIDINTSQASDAITHDLMQIPYPFPARTFDAITCSEVLEHLFYPERVYKEARRLIKKTGVFIVSTPNHDWVMHLINRFDKLLYNTKYSHLKEHIRFYNYETHKKFLNENGFAVVDFAGADGHYCDVFAAPIKAIAKQFNLDEHELFAIAGEKSPLIQHTIMLVGKPV